MAKPTDRAESGTLPPLRGIIARHGLSARKGLGQNFLLDLNLTRRIVRTAGDLEGIDVIEIGPGPGGLTRALLDSNARHITAIERDQRCIGALTELAAAYPDKLTILNKDALKTDISQLVSGRTKIIANLPYNIATALLIRWIPDFGRLDGLTLMFQKEVAERLVARAGSKTYGRLSVIVQWIAHTIRHFDVPPTAFVPQPKVTSTVVGITPRERPLAPANRVFLERITAATFGQRRKMMRASLRTLDVNTDSLLERASASPTARPEDLDISVFCALARALEELENAD